MTGFLSVDVRRRPLTSAVVRSCPRMSADVRGRLRMSASVRRRLRTSPLISRSVALLVVGRISSQMLTYIKTRVHTTNKQQNNMASDSVFKAPSMILVSVFKRCVTSSMILAGWFKVWIVPSNLLFALNDLG